MAQAVVHLKIKRQINIWKDVHLESTCNLFRCISHKGPKYVELQEVVNEMCNIVETAIWLVGHVDQVELGSVHELC